MSQISDENLAALEKRHRTTVFIVLAHIFVVLFLIAVSFILAPRIETALSEQDVTSIWIALMFIAIGSFILRRMFNSWERLKNVALLKGIAGLLGTLQRNAVILGLFALAAATLGFVISIITGNSFDMLRAGTIALVVFLINFPRKGIWKTVVANLEKT